MHSLKTARRGAQVLPAEQVTSLPPLLAPLGTQPDLNGQFLFFLGKEGPSIWLG